MATIESEIPQDRARWGYTTAKWETHVQRVRDYTKDGARTKRVLEDLKTYFGLTDAQMKAYFGNKY